MNITITARHGDHDVEGIATYAEDKVLKLDRYLDRIDTVEVVLDGDADTRHRCELIIGGVRGQVFVTECESPTPQAAIDRCVDKMERQLTKYKEKRRDSHRKSSRNEPVVLDASATDYDVDDEPTYEDVSDTP